MAAAEFGPKQQLFWLIYGLLWLKYRMIYPTGLTPFGRGPPRSVYWVNLVFIEARSLPVRESQYLQKIIGRIWWDYEKLLNYGGLYYTETSTWKNNTERNLTTWDDFNEFRTILLHSTCSRHGRSDVIFTGKYLYMKSIHWKVP